MKVNSVTNYGRSTWIGKAVILAFALSALPVATATADQCPGKNYADCLSAASSGQSAWGDFCASLDSPVVRAGCRSKTLESTQNKNNWCAGQFGD